MGAPRIKFNPEVDGYSSQGGGGSRGDLRTLAEDQYVRVQGNKVRALVFGGSGDLALEVGARLVDPDGELVDRAYISGTVTVPVSNPEREVDVESMSEDELKDFNKIKKDRLKKAYQFLSRLDPDFGRKYRWNNDEKRFEDENGDEVDDKMARKHNYKLETTAAETLVGWWNELAGDAADDMLNTEKYARSESAKIDGFSGVQFYVKTVKNKKDKITFYDVLAELPDGVRAADVEDMFADEA